MTFGLVTTLVASPAVATLGYSVLTQNDAMRPLSVSVQAVRTNLFGGSAVVRAEVTVGSSGLSDTQQDHLSAQIENAFLRREVPVDVTFRTDTTRPGTTISYHVGPAEVGPLPLRDASKGVRAAIEAYRLAR